MKKYKESDWHLFWVEMASQFPQTGKIAGPMALILLVISIPADLGTVPEELKWVALITRAPSILVAIYGSLGAFLFPDFLSRFYTATVVAVFLTICLGAIVISGIGGGIQTLYFTAIFHSELIIATFLPIKNKIFITIVVIANLLYLVLLIILAGQPLDAEFFNVFLSLFIFAVLAAFTNRFIIQYRFKDFLHMNTLERLVDERTEKLLSSQNRLRELGKRLVETKEKEGARIARELHDELGQVLTVLRIQSSLLGMRLKEDLSSEGIQDVLKSSALISKLADESLESLRGITRELRPKMLDDIGLAATIEWQAQEFGRRTALNVKCNTAVDDASFLPSFATSVFRICQEALTNIARHASAKDVEVDLIESSDSLVLQISDDGIGIPIESEKKVDSYGIYGMMERAKLINGKLDITGNMGKGTTICLTAPVQKI